MSPRGRRLAAFAVFAGPVILGVGLFSYIPVLWGFVLSVFEARGTVAPQRFVGLSNYGQSVSTNKSRGVTALASQSWRWHDVCFPLS